MVLNVTSESYFIYKFELCHDIRLEWEIAQFNILAEVEQRVIWVSSLLKISYAC